MSYFTLDEAAVWLAGRMEAKKKAPIARITAAAILKIGIHGRLRIVVPLSTRCYSPTLAARNMREGLKTNPKEWASTSAQENMDAATVKIVDFFVVPVVHLFEFEIRDVVRLKQVTSLDGNDIYNPHEDIDRSRLRVLLEDLESLASAATIVSAHGDIDDPSRLTPLQGTPKKLSSDQEQEAVRLYDRSHGMSVTQIAKRLDVSRPTIDKVLVNAKVKTRRK